MDDLKTRGDATAKSVVLGFLMFLSGLVCISASVLLVIGLKIRESKGRLCHRNYLSLSLVISDCIQLCPVVLLGSPSVALQRNVFSFSYETVRAIYSVAIFGWVQSSFLMIVMAMNRYAFICDSRVAFIFEFPKIRWVVRFCWLFAALIVVLTQYIFPGYAESFMFAYYTIVPVQIPMGNDWAFFNMNVPLVVVTLFISCFCYAAILRRMRASTASVAAHLTGSEECRRRENEKRFARQFLSIFATYAAAAIGFRLIPPLVEMNVRQQISSLIFHTDDSSGNENIRRPLLNPAKKPINGPTFSTHSQTHALIKKS